MEGRSNFLTALLAFLVLLFLALLIFSVASWLEGFASVWWSDPGSWLAKLDRQAAVDTISNAAEVVAGVLAIAITVVAIVVELAANRYTHRITTLFVREPANVVVMGFFVLTTVQCVWISATLGGAAPEHAIIPYAGLVLCMIMVTGCLLVLLPYFAFVFGFLSPINVIARIRSQAAGGIRGARIVLRPDTRHNVMEAIEELEDIARGAMQQSDRGISMAAVDALAELLLDYSEVREGLPAEWFEVDEALARDPDFVSLDVFALKEINDNRLWLDLKVLRQYQSMFSDSLGHARDIGNLIALNTCRVGARAAEGNLPLLELCLRFFNSYLRAAINARDLRTAYYVLHQYRFLAQAVLSAGHMEQLLAVADYFRYYGQLGYTAGQAFLLEVVAYDLGFLVEVAVEADSPAADALLERFLEVDRESQSAEQEARLRNVRRAQVQLATFFLERGDETRARLIFEDMLDDDPERLASVRDELLAESRPQFWEVTDRGINFAYLPPGRREKVPEFFSWFGERVTSRSGVPTP